MKPGLKMPGRHRVLPTIGPACHSMQRAGSSMFPLAQQPLIFMEGDRIGNDLFADTLLALDANTGKRIWHFQDVHHDIWDRDFPSATNPADRGA
jgi:outer membrane protein assembly factor BamB